MGVSHLVHKMMTFKLHPSITEERIAHFSAITRSFRLLESHPSTIHSTPYHPSHQQQYHVVPTDSSDHTLTTQKRSSQRISPLLSSHSCSSSSGQSFWPESICTNLSPTTQHQLRDGHFGTGVAVCVSEGSLVSIYDPFRSSGRMSR